MVGFGAMTVSDLMDALAAHGAALTLTGDRVTVTAAAPLSDALLAALRAPKADIVAALQARGATASRTAADLVATLPQAPCPGGCGRQSAYGGECLSCRLGQALASGAGTTAAVTLVGLFINRSPVVASAPHARYNKSTRTLDVFGCGLSHGFAVGRTVPANVLINVQCPAVPRTNDGKQPHLRPFRDLLTKAMADAARVAYLGHAGGLSQKEMIWEALPAALDAMSEGGHYTYLLQQLAPRWKVSSPSTWRRIPRTGGASPSRRWRGSTPLMMGAAPGLSPSRVHGGRWSDDAT
jgi:hypothetical protein